MIPFIWYSPKHETILSGWKKDQWLSEVLGRGRYDYKGMAQGVFYSDEFVVCPDYGGNSCGGG